MQYSEKLKDPRWQKKRLEILERDGWKCMSCGEKETTLHVHHIFYFPGKEPWEINNGFLITFCEHCHSNKSGCEGQSCESCEEYGVDCDGSTIHPKEIIESIGIFLDELWRTDKDGDYCASLGFLWSRIKGDKNE